MLTRMYVTLDCLAVSAKDKLVGIYTVSYLKSLLYRSFSYRYSRPLKEGLQER